MEKRYWTVGQLDSGLELSSLMSRSSAFRSETEDHEFGESPTKLTSLDAQNPALIFLQSTMVWGGMSAAEVGPLCILQTNVTAAVYQEALEYFVLPTAEQLFGGDEFTFQHNLTPSHNAKSTKMTKTTSGLPVWDTGPVLVSKLSGS